MSAERRSSVLVLVDATAAVRGPARAWADGPGPRDPGPVEAAHVGATGVAAPPADVAAPGDPSLPAALRQVLAAARRTGTRVVHLHVVDPDVTGAGQPTLGAMAPPELNPPELNPGMDLNPAPGDTVLVGRRGDVFATAGLDALVRDASVERIVLAGLLSADTVADIARRASDLGVRTTVLVDATVAEGGGGEPVAVPPPATAATVAGFPADRRPHPSRRRRLTLIVGLVLVVAAIAVGWAVIDHGANQYYAFSPGTAPTLTLSSECQPHGSGGDLALPNGTPCTRIDLPPGKGQSGPGQLFMVDVLVGKATPGDYLLSRLHLLSHFRSGTQLVPAKDVLGTTPASQLSCQDTQQMNDATTVASVVALRRLSYPVTENDLGAQIDLVQPGSAAAAAGIKCNDVITEVGGTPIHTNTDLVTAIRALRPGDAVRITRTTVGTDGKPLTDTVTAHLTGTPAVGGQPGNPEQAYLGVASESKVTYQFPFPVNVDVGGIGGPSAGLALTLGLLNSLGGGHLLGGHQVAATGTMDLQGNVGDVGGVAQKTVAVRKAGAQVFLVPPEEYKVALSEAGPNLKVYAVTTLEQALDRLQALGGQVPPPPPSSSTPPSSAA
jgi:PDZ domain-containing protein